MFHYLYQLVSFDPGSWLKTTTLAIIRSLFEGVGLLVLVPVLAIAGLGEGEAVSSSLVNGIRGILAYFSIPATPASLLLLFMVLVVLRGLTGFAYNSSWV